MNQKLKDKIFWGVWFIVGVAGLYLLNIPEHQFFGFIITPVGWFFWGYYNRVLVENESG